MGYGEQVYHGLHAEVRGQLVGSGCVSLGLNSGHQQWQPILFPVLATPGFVLQGFLLTFSLFPNLFLFLNYKHVCICVEVCAHECSAHRGQKRALDPLELEFHAVMSCLIGVLGTEPGVLFRNSMYS